MEKREQSAPADLSVREISVTFGGITALDAVSLDVSKGEVLGIIGPNGAGKTTLFNVICGFVRPLAGALTWRGEPLTGIRPHRLAKLGIARTLQGVGLFPHLTVLENVMLGAHHLRRANIFTAMLGLPWSDRDESRIAERAWQAMVIAGCEDVHKRLPPTLPYAVQKRVALARALACEPDLLLLDEPAGGLGAEDLSALSKLIDSLSSSMAVMLVDHHMDLVISTCDRVVVLDFGKVIASGPAAEVRKDPQVLEAYLGREAEAQALEEEAAPSA